MSELIDNEIHTIYYHRYPYPFRFGSYLALLRSLTIKPLVTQLYPQTQLNHQTYERLMRTRQLIRTLIYFGLKSDKGQTAIATINRAHQAVIANNDDYLYVLSTFFLEPFRWNTSFQKQIISTQDQQKVVDFWCAVGEQMPIKGLFTDTNTWLVFQQQYESEYMGYSDEGSELATRSIDELIKQAAPFGLRNLAQQVLIATTDPKVKVCLGLPNSVIPQEMIIWLLNSARINCEPRKDIIDEPLT